VVNTPSGKMNPQKPMLNLSPPTRKRVATDVTPCTSHQTPAPHIISPTSVDTTKTTCARARA